MIGAALLWVAAAMGGGLQDFEGEWGLDPTRSDDPTPMLMALARIFTAAPRRRILPPRVATASITSGTP